LGTASAALESRTTVLRQRINHRLSELIPAESEEPQRLHRAMRHSLLGGGKRIRPIITITVAGHLGDSEAQALDPACAVEMVHAASLIIDDLPLMDDATVRRGQPANHIVFGEDTALLAAMALLNRAYAVTGSAPGLDPELRMRLVSLLSDAIGSNGLIGGQMLDLEDWPGRDAGALEQTNMLKTAALFVVGAETGALISGVSASEVEAVRHFARDLGLAFQVFDDLLDVSHSEVEAGKNVDQDGDKVTLVSLMGADKARDWAEQLLGAAADHLSPLGQKGEFLIELTRLLLPRANSAPGGGH